MKKCNETLWKELAVGIVNGGHTYRMLITVRDL